MFPGMTKTVTLRYIPGTALRGVVINTLAQDKDFEVIKKSLFSTNIRYLNAYLTDGDRELIPSPKGFYEDKMQCQGRKPLDNVVINGEFEEGKKGHLSEDSAIWTKSVSITIMWTLVLI